MNRNTRLALPIVGLMSTFALLTGCDGAYPKPDSDAAVRSLKNARVNGKMRACWPAGQAYIEAILKADGKLRAALGTPHPTPTVLALPVKADPSWRPEDTAASEDEGESPQPPADYAKALDKLTAVVDELPDDLPDESEAAREEFVGRVWEALAVDGVPLCEFAEQTNEMREARQCLKTRIGECKESFDEKASGLRFTDETCQAEVDKLYDGLAATLHNRQESFLDYAAQQMAHVHERIGEVHKQKERDEYLYLDNQRTYFTRVLKEGWLKSIQDQITAKKDALDGHESGKAKLTPEKLEVLKAELTRLEAAYADLSKRITAILAKPGEEQD